MNGQTGNNGKDQRYGGPLRIPALFISYLFHPLFIPVYLSLFIHFLSPLTFTPISLRQRIYWLVSVFVNTLLLPLLGVLLLRATGFLKSLHMPDARERIIPVMITMITYFWIYQVSKGSPAKAIEYVMPYPLILRILFLGNFWGIILIFLSNIFFKVSMHTAAAGSMIGITLVLVFLSNVSMVVPLFAVTLLAGIIGTARMILGAHRPGDIYAGYIIGIAVQVAAYLYLK